MQDECHLLIVCSKNRAATASHILPDVPCRSNDPASTVSLASCQAKWYEAQAENGSEYAHTLGCQLERDEVFTPLWPPDVEFYMDQLCFQGFAGEQRLEQLVFVGLSAYLHPLDCAPAR